MASQDCELPLPSVKVADTPAMLRRDLVLGFVPPSGDPIVGSLASADVENSFRQETDDWLFVDSGTSALIVALLDAARLAANARQISKPKVVIPAYCCPAILSAIRYVGAEAQLVDFETGTCFLDLKALKELVDESTIAVIAINFCGIHERVSAIQDVLTGSSARLIYDCCQWFPRRPMTDLPADYVTFSFGRSKPVSVLHGGAVLSRTAIRDLPFGANPDRSSARAIYKAKLAAYHFARLPPAFALLNMVGLAGGTEYREARAPAPMDVWARALLPANVDAFRRRHQEEIEALVTTLRVSGKLLRTLPSSQDAGLPTDAYYWRLPLLAANRNDRDELVGRLRRKGIGASVLYGKILLNIPSINLHNDPEAYPVAQWLAENLITLPTHSEMNARRLESIRTVIDTLTEDRQCLDGGMV